MPTRRQERVGKRVVQELTEAFRNLKNVDLGFITVTRCEASQDLRHAKVFVTVFGEEEQRKKTLETLRRNAARLKGMIGRPLGTKVVPNLHFEFDDTVATADEISRLIRDARATDANQEPLSAEELAELSGGAKARPVAPEAGVDVFEAARRDVDAELYGDEDEDGDGWDDDPSWKPINLDELPDDGE